ncbi:hypothetical protein E1180_00230 [Roseibium denhamense]|nr:hypothetical protein [Roseibium denhamense]MTI03952.1 hypothetical protein [Roseibium denhamense]
MSTLELETFERQIDRLITRALEMGRVGDKEEAVHAFALCRVMLASRASKNELERRVKLEQVKLRTEADQMREHFLGLSSDNPQRRVTVYSDSLGLPRPQEMDAYESTVKLTYSGQLMRLLSEESNGNEHLDTNCQRFCTTNEVIALMYERPESLKGADVLIHVGLNDCSIRMFMAPQRIACGLLPAAIREKVLEFARVYRVDLVKAFPHHQYVPLDTFQSNLFKIANLTKENGAKSLTFSTIVLVPMRFWPSTPGVVKNFTSYNMAIMQIADQVGANVLEIDRLMWQHGTGSMLDKDGMHLSHRGHEMLADLYLKILRGV